jgi:hypothetical protein
MKDKGDNYGVSIFIGMTAWRPLFSYGDIKAEMVPLP